MRTVLNSELQRVSTRPVTRGKEVPETMLIPQPAFVTDL